MLGYSGVGGRTRYPDMYHPPQAVLVSFMKSSGHILTALRGVLKTFGALVDNYIAGFSSPALSDSDVIIDQLPGCLFGFDLAETLHVPHIIASVIPLSH